MMIKKPYIIIGFAAILLIAFLPGFSQLQQMKEETRILERQIKTLQRINEELRERIDRLENDPVFLEKVAREKLHETKEGEIIYRVR